RDRHREARRHLSRRPGSGNGRRRPGFEGRHHGNRRHFRHQQVRPARRGKNERAVLATLSLAHRADGWQPPVVKTTATEGHWIVELIDTIQRYHSFFQNSAVRLERRKEAARQRLMTLLEERLVKTAVQQAFPDGKIDMIVEEIAGRRLDPYSVVDEVIRN